MVFEDAQAHSGWTLPSMASLFTGLLPHEHRAVRDPNQDDAQSSLLSEYLTLAELYQAAGHRTAAFTNNTFLDPAFGLDQGFSHYDHQGAGYTDHRTAEQTVDAALSWLGSGSEPAFVLLHVMEPHLDYDPPESVAGAFTQGIDAPIQVPFGDHTRVTPLIEGKVETTPEQRDYIQRVYDEEVLAVDEALGRAITALQARERPTWIVLTADHGEEFWDHGGFEHGHHLLRELVRVPLVISGPGVQARRIREPVSHQDVFVTLATKSGADLTHRSQGLDLGGVLSAGAAVPSGRVLFGENCLYGTECMSAYRDGVRLLFRPTVGNVALYHRGPDGQSEVVWDDAQARDSVGLALYQALLERRGGAEVIDVGEHIVRVEGTSVEQLRALGYIE